MLIKEVVRANLKRLRQAHSLSQVQASKAIGIPYKTYQSYEEGRATPGLERIRVIIKFYGIDFNTFLSSFEVVFKPGV